MNLEQLNLSITIDGSGTYYGTFRQWREFISELAQGRSEEYRAAVRCNQESVTSMVRYLRRTFQPRVEAPEPGNFGLRLNPSIPSEEQLITALLAA